MTTKNIKDFLFGKLFFPKVVVIDKPGVIYSYVDRKFGSPIAKRRMIYVFEDVLANLQINTIKELGLSETQRIYYQLSKKQVARYLLLGDLKKPSAFLVSPILHYILRIYRSAGASVAEKISFNPQTKTLILEGRDNLFCRKSGLGDYIAGGTSMLISFLTGESIEAIAECKKCPKQCRIVANPKFQIRYKLNLDDMKPSKEYVKLNFPKKMDIPHGVISLANLVNFRKISIDSTGKLYFKGEVLTAAEIGWVALIAEQYREINREALFKETVIQTSQKLVKRITKNIHGKKKKERFLISLLAAFGWGIPYLKKINSGIIVILMYAPFSRYSPLYLAYSINGFLNHTFQRKHKLDKINSNFPPFRVEFVFSC